MYSARTFKSGDLPVVCTETAAPFQATSNWSYTMEKVSEIISGDISEAICCFSEFVAFLCFRRVFAYSFLVYPFTYRKRDFFMYADFSGGK